MRNVTSVIVSVTHWCYSLTIRYVYRLNTLKYSSNTNLNGSLLFKDVNGFCWNISLLNSVLSIWISMFLKRLLWTKLWTYSCCVMKQKLVFFCSWDTKWIRKFIPPVRLSYDMFDKRFFDLSVLINHCKIRLWRSFDILLIYISGCNFKNIVFYSSKFVWYLCYVDTRLLPVIRMKSIFVLEQTSTPLGNECKKSWNMTCICLVGNDKFQF